LGGKMHRLDGGRGRDDMCEEKGKKPLKKSPSRKRLVVGQKTPGKGGKPGGDLELLVEGGTFQLRRKEKNPTSGSQAYPRRLLGKRGEGIGWRGKRAPPDSELSEKGGEQLPCPEGGDGEGKEGEKTRPYATA